MKGLLLDTHLFLAQAQEIKPTGPMNRLLSRVAESKLPTWVSVASLWEIAIKVRLGKLALRRPIGELPGLVEASGARLLPIETAHVLVDLTPQPATRDPFDRLLLAQCVSEQLRFATLDDALATHPLAIA